MARARSWLSEFKVALKYSRSSKSFPLADQQVSPNAKKRIGGDCYCQIRGQVHQFGGHPDLISLKALPQGQASAFVVCFGLKEGCKIIPQGHDTSDNIT
jgi:hypothetical protein